MKTVTFETAKWLKDIGYPQKGNYWYSPEGVECYSESDLDEIKYIIAPSYLDCWIWLWREKKIYINTDVSYGCTISAMISKTGMIAKFNESFYSQDPEEAIEKAINFLVENNY